MTRTRLPARNATLTRVAGAGYSEDYDQPASPDTPRWEGAADALLAERVEETVNGRQVDELRVSTVVVPFDLARLVEINDTLTLIDRLGTERARTVRQVRLNRFAGTGRVWLEDE